MDLINRIEWLEDQVNRVAKQQLIITKQKTVNTEHTTTAVQLGYLFTAIYVVFVLFVTKEKIGAFFSDESELNNIGDFLAGLFAPLAFLWLFVGVRIQSVELRNQIHQLTANVEHQNEIAKSTSASLDVHRPHLYIEDITLMQTYQDPNNAKVIRCPCEFTIANSGGTARNLAYSLSIDTPPKRPIWHQHKYETLKEGQQHTYQVHLSVLKHSSPFLESKAPWMVEKALIPQGGVSKLIITFFGIDEIGRPFRQDFRTNSEVQFPTDHEGRRLKIPFHEIKALEIADAEELPEVVATEHIPII